MIKVIALTTFLLMVLIACRYDHMAATDSNSKLIVKTGTICGWCAVNDTLSIQGDSIRYVNYTGCSNVRPAVEKKGQLLTGELDELLSKLDINELIKIDLNSCNVCVDGCDDWIFFDNGVESHYIRYGKGDPKLEMIRTFVDELNAIKARYSPEK
jgi:hypothetical protein